MGPQSQESHVSDVLVEANTTTRSRALGRSLGTGREVLHHFNAVAPALPEVSLVGQATWRASILSPLAVRLAA